MKKTLYLLSALCLNMASTLYSASASNLTEHDKQLLDQAETMVKRAYADAASYTTDTTTQQAYAAAAQQIGQARAEFIKHDAGSLLDYLTKVAAEGPAAVTADLKMRLRTYARLVKDYTIDPIANFAFAMYLLNGADILQQYTDKGMHNKSAFTFVLNRYPDTRAMIGINWLADQADSAKYKQEAIKQIKERDFAQISPIGWYQFAIPAAWAKALAAKGFIQSQEDLTTVLSKMTDAAKTPKTVTQLNTLSGLQPEAIAASLHEAVINRNAAQVTKFLHDAPEATTQTDAAGNYPLFYAITGDKPINQAIIQTLIKDENNAAPLEQVLEHMATLQTTTDAQDDAILAIVNRLAEITRIAQETEARRISMQPKSLSSRAVLSKKPHQSTADALSLSPKTALDLLSFALQLGDDDDVEIAVEVVRQLPDNELNSIIYPKSGTNLLMRSLYLGKSFAPVTNALLDKGADVDRIDTHNKSVLDYALLSPKGNTIDTLTRLAERAHHLDSIKSALARLAEPQISRSFNTHQVTELQQILNARLQTLDTQNKLTEQLKKALDSDNPNDALAAIKAGARIHDEDVFLYTPLMLAANNGLGWEKVVDLLLEKGADAAFKYGDRTGLGDRTALSEAIASKHPSLMIVSSIINSITDADTIAKAKEFKTFYFTPFYEQVENLLAVRLNQLRSITTQTPNAQLIKAITDGKPAEVLSALNAGADINNVGLKHTPLMLAANNGQGWQDVVNLLLEKGARVTDKYAGKTALDYAITAENPSFDAIRALADSITDVHEINAALEVARKVQTDATRDQILHILTARLRTLEGEQKKEEQPTPTTTPQETKDGSPLAALIAAISSDNPNFDNISALAANVTSLDEIAQARTAAYKAQTGITRARILFLLSLRVEDLTSPAGVAAQLEAATSPTELLVNAIADKNPETALGAIRANADIHVAITAEADMPDVGIKITPLMAAAYYGQGWEFVVDLLLAKGAHASAKDKQGRPALMYAILSPKPSVDSIRVIADKYADQYRNIADFTGALYIARQKNLPQPILDILADRIRILESGDTVKAVTPTTQTKTTKETAEVAPQPAETPAQVIKQTTGETLTETQGQKPTVQEIGETIEIKPIVKVIEQVANKTLGHQDIRKLWQQIAPKNRKLTSDEVEQLITYATDPRGATDRAINPQWRVSRQLIAANPKAIEGSGVDADTQAKWDQVVTHMRRGR